MTKQDWISILKLATKWNFKDFRALALEKLTRETMDPIEKVSLAGAYDIPQWLRTGFDTLATRNEPLSVAEAKEIGYPVAIRVCQIREEIRVFSHQNDPLLVGSAYKAIEREFREELGQVGMVCDPIVETPAAALEEEYRPSMSKDMGKAKAKDKDKGKGKDKGKSKDKAKSKDKDKDKGKDQAKGKSTGKSKDKSKDKDKAKSKGKGKS
jgi:hypothetical protein